MITNVNKVICGDNLSILKEIPIESIDLVYLDPPFFSGKNYEVIWGDANEVMSFGDTSKHFEEQNKLGFREFTDEEKEYYKRNSGGMSHYLIWMKDRLKLMHQVLKPNGSIYLHCDWHASHYLKIEMDKIFGYGNFRNEIVWFYPAMSAAKKHFPRKHDVVLFYSKTEEYTFNGDDVREAYDEKTVKRYKTDVIFPGGYKAEMNEKGRLPYDVWQIPPIRNNSVEKQGYPTQKPEALLERIIKVSSNSGDMVLDPFCGCGTTIVVAKRLGRNFIGIDISPKSCKLMAKRIGYDEVDIVGLPIKIEDLIKMEPHEFQQWVCDKMIAKNTSPSPNYPSGGDGGKDGIVINSISTGGYGGSPIQIKRSNGVGVNTVKNLFATMHGMKVKNGFIVALSFGAGAVEQVAKYKLNDNINIKLVVAQSLCKIRNYNYKADVVSNGEMKEEDFWIS